MEFEENLYTRFLKRGCIVRLTKPSQRWSVVSVLIDKPWGNEKERKGGGNGAQGLDGLLQACPLGSVHHTPRNRKQKQQETFMNRST